MKKSFWLVLVFFVFFLLLVLAVSFFSMLAENCIHMKVGVKTDFFNGTYFLNGCIRYLPWCAIISLLMLALYIIKHKFSIPQFIVPYYILALLVWMLVIPGCSFLYDSVQQSYPVPLPDTENLSTGYFREDGEYLTYVTGTSDASGEMWRRKVFSEPAAVDGIKGDTFADSLIEKVIKAPDWGTFVHEKCLLLKKVCSSSLSLGYFSYILFATMGFALSSVIFLCKLSSWRLVNGLSVILVFALIISSNICFYDPALVGKIPFLGKWWLPLTFNVSLCVIFATVGIINWVHHPERNRGVR